MTTQTVLKAKAIFDRHLLTLREKNAKTFRNEVLHALTKETGCTWSAATGRYNSAKKLAISAGELADSDFGFSRKYVKRTEVVTGPTGPQNMTAGVFMHDRTTSDSIEDYLPWAVVSPDDQIVHTVADKEAANRLCEEPQRIMPALEALGLQPKAVTDEINS